MTSGLSPAPFTPAPFTPPPFTQPRYMPSALVPTAFVAAPRLIVVGVDSGGFEVARLVLGHGQDPAALLVLHGWQVQRAREVSSDTAGNHVLTLSFEVERHAAAPLAKTEPRRDEDLAMADGEAPFRYQRVAAYALVTSSRGVLMTQFSERTNAQGQWGLPGGGLEVDEAPERAVVREVWEESGQVIEVKELAMVHSSHWIGRAPAGRLEDFHAIRVVYRAACPEPTDPTVHDVGGTTASAAWEPPADLDRLDFTASWRSLLSALATAPGQADRP